MIPKIIHQIWLGPKKRPDIWMNSWKIDYLKQYPDWEYKLWTEKEIEQLEMVNKKQYHNDTYYTAKSDIARYEILNQFGGIFIDADSLWIKENNISLDKYVDMAINSGMFAATEPINKQFIANGVIGFTKNHPIIQQMILYINNYYFQLKSKNTRLRDVWAVTGPKIFSLLLTFPKKDNRHFKGVPRLDFTTIQNNNIYEKHNICQNILNYNRQHFNIEAIINKIKIYILLLESYHFYPECFHKNNLDLDQGKFHINYPNSIMFQYGYTSNNILRNNIMEKYIENN